MRRAARDLRREPGKGFEPPTGRLQGGCSTSELPGRDAAGVAPPAALRAACQHASAFGFRLSARFGPSVLAFGQELWGPARRCAPHALGIVAAQSPHRHRHCSLAESGALQGVACAPTSLACVSLLVCAAFPTKDGLLIGTFA